jgi:signal transduction histidine kinase/DNA-binding NarL/FixJ family response regulator
LARIAGAKLRHATHEWCAPGVASQSHELKELPGDSFPWWTSVLARNEAIVLDDVASQAPDEVRHMLLAQQVRSLLVLPVIINDELEAFIGFDDVRSVRQWRSEEVALLRTMVESLSRAIERRIRERERAAASVQIRDALERAESANQLKSAFLASMSHELRTPMTAIMGFANLLRRDAGSAEEHHTWADSIARNADHLLALLNDLLDLSKIEAGQLTVVAEACDPTQIAADVVKHLRPLAAEKSLSLELVINAAPTVTCTDGLRLRQIIVNLVSNAIRYTDAGFVRVHVSSTTSHRSDRMTIAVSDTGIGIPADKQDLLFLPFSQVHADAPRRGGGVGLGLNISRKLTELLGGTLTFTSTVGEGSEFVVTLPIVAPHSAGSPPHRQPTEARLATSNTGLLAGTRILVTEDTPDNRRLLTYLLIEAGASVTQAQDGRQACEICLQSGGAAVPFDVILLDMQMPVLDGYAATERLRRGGVTTPILALTAFAMADDRDHCLRAGCDDYLSKPIDESALLDTIAAHCRRGVAGAARSADYATPQDPPAAGNSPASPKAVFLEAERPWLEAVIRDFKNSLPALCDECSQAIESRDFRSATQIAHRIRGVAANFRLPELAEAAAAFEDEHRLNGDSARLITLGPELLAALRAAAATPE